MRSFAAISTLALLVPASDLQAHALLFPPPSAADIHLSPRSFMESIKSSFDRYHNEHGTFPAVWLDIDKETNTRLDDKTRCTRDGNSLSVFKNDKLINVFVIARSDQDDYFVHSSNSRGEANWCRDRNFSWLYYLHEVNELQEIDRRAKILAHSNDLRRLALLLTGWEFKHPRAFEVLFTELERPGNSQLIRYRLIIRLSNDLPYMERFKSYLPRLEAMIVGAASKSDPTYNETQYHRMLVELRDEISGKREPAATLPGIPD